MTVSPASATVEAGKTQQFTAAVTGTGSYDQTVTWSVSGNQSNETTIDQNGLLTVAADETVAATLTVTATATGDNTKSGTASVTVEPPHVHDFGADWKSDATNHWHVCACGEISGTAAHVYDNNQDTTCNVCGYTRPVSTGGGGGGGGGGGSSRPTGPSTDNNDGWTDIREEIADADKGDTITIDMNGETEVPGEIFEEVAGKDVTVEFDMGGGVSWTVNGQDVPTGTDFTDLDLGVDMGTSGISVDVINAVTGEYGSVQVSLEHDGEFGFALTLTAPLGRENAGLWANLYHYDEEAETLTFVSSTRIARDGSAALRMTHASQYAIVIDEKSHALPFLDVPEGHWAEAAIRYVWENGLMNGTGGSAFNPGGTVSRQQVWMILARMAGADPADMAAAKAWAVDSGISDGTSPGGAVTRQQFAALLYRFAVMMGYDVSVGESTNILSYADAFDAAEYAIPALQWACGAGIIHGTGDGSTLSPQGTATRAQAAVMLERFCEWNK